MPDTVNATTMYRRIIMPTDTETPLAREMAIAQQLPTEPSESMTRKQDSAEKKTKATGIEGYTSHPSPGEAHAGPVAGQNVAA